MSTLPDSPITRKDLEALRADIHATVLAAVREAFQDAHDLASIQASLAEPGDDITMEELERRAGLR